MKWGLTALLVPILLRLFFERCPRLAQRIVRRASRRMPEAYQDRCADEWLAYLADTDGELSKLAVALGYWVRIPKFRRAVGAAMFRFRIPRAPGMAGLLRRGVARVADPRAATTRGFLVGATISSIIATVVGLISHSNALVVAATSTGTFLAGVTVTAVLRVRGSQKD